MGEYLAEHILHALVAATVIETLLRIWRLADPAERLAFRLLALTLPLVIGPVFWTCAPFRLDPVFADSFALFSRSHWADVRFGRIGLGALLLVVASVAGGLLYARDLTPLARRGRSHERPGVELGEDDPLQRTVGDLATRVGLGRPPRVHLLDDGAPVLFASGVLRPALVVSRGTVERLDEAELRATLAHELAHLGRGDVLLGWGVMIARTLMLFNPIAQLVARGVVLEMERRADDTAARVLEAPRTLADGMERLVGTRLRAGPRARQNAVDGLVLGLAIKGRAAALARRCSRLRERWPPRRHALAGLRVGLTAIALAGLLFFVV